MASEVALAQIRDKIQSIQKSKVEGNEKNVDTAETSVPDIVIDENDLKDERQLEIQLLMDKIKPAKSGKKRNYSQIDISADKWFLTLDPEAFKLLSEPPSLADGLDLKEEKELRLLGCEMIANGAILLKLPQTAAATGQILFQRYYYQRSFVRCNFIHTVMACLLLASRIEEAPRRARDVINVINRLKQLMSAKQSNRDVSDRSTLSHIKIDRNYSELKNLVIKTERRLLNVLGFVVHVHHPHKLIISYGHVLGINHERKDILIKAWNYMNDGLRTDIFLRYSAETIACACLFLAARTVESPIVLPTEPKPWYELYDCTTEDIKYICLVLLNLYNNQKIPNLSRLSSHVEKLYKEKYAKPEPPPPEPKKEEDKRSDRDKDRSKRSKTPKRDRGDRRERRRERSRSRSQRRERDGKSDREGKSDRDTRTKKEKERDRERDRDRRDRRRDSRTPPIRNDRRRDRDYDRDRSSNHRRRN